MTTCACQIPMHNRDCPNRPCDCGCHRIAANLPGNYPHSALCTDRRRTQTIRIHGLGSEYHSNGPNWSRVASERYGSH